MRNATVTFCFPSYTQSRGLHEIGYSRPLYADPLRGLSPLPPYYPSPGVTVFAARARPIINTCINWFTADRFPERGVGQELLFSLYAR